jgi:hypothetical protein
MADTVGSVQPVAFLMNGTALPKASSNSELPFKINAAPIPPPKRPPPPPKMKRECGPSDSKGKRQCKNY